MKNDDKYIFDLKPEDQSAESRRDIMGILHKGIRDIELQLGSKERLGADSKRLPAAKYHKWRKAAIKAMNHRVELYRRYKALEKDAIKHEQAKATTAKPVQQANFTNDRPELTHFGGEIYEYGYATRYEEENVGSRPPFPV